MCTLSVIAHENGYLLGMNRDERISRGTALPPQQITLGGTKAFYPRDTLGGTWVGCNEHRVALALLNWNDVTPPGANALKTRSRGLVIPELIRFRLLGEIQAALDSLDLKGTLPFRLVGIFPAEKQIWEWNWDMARVQSQNFPWAPRHWFSSGMSDQQAAALRGATCESAWKEAGAGSISWLRQLHRSHANGPGPFSVCVHREDARTVSYTEVVCTADAVHLSYFPGNPCSQLADQVEWMA